MSDELPRNRHSEKLSETFDQKMLDFNLKLLGLLTVILLKPLAQATDPFFRKNLGIRYFNLTTFTVCCILWLVAGIVGRFGCTLLGELADFNGWGRLAEWLSRPGLTKMITWVVFFAYAFFGGKEIENANARFHTGVRWHSLSRGESRFGSENTQRDLLIGVLISIVLFILAPAIGLLFVASRIASYQQAKKQMESFYMRYHDVTDAEIDGQFLHATLRDGKPPKTTDGIYSPLPKQFTGQHRDNVARVIASLPVTVLPKPIQGRQEPSPEIIVPK